MERKVSVIIPAYNCEKYIFKCISSILEQSYKNIEVIIINDGSTDGTELEVKKIFEADNRIIYIKQENSGPSMARNKGIDIASGEFIVFVDADDSIEKKYIEIMVQEVIQKNLDIAFCGYKDISIYGKYNISDFYEIDNIEKKELIYKILSGTGGVLWGKIFKRKIICENNIKLNKKVFMCEDLIFVLQYIKYSNKFRGIDKYLYRYNRLNENSITAKLNSGYLENNIIVIEEINSILKSMNFTKFELENIFSKRVQSIVLSLLDSNSKKLNNIKIRNKQIYEIIDNRFIRNYTEKFLANSILNKPYIFFIKKRMTYGILLYGYSLNKLKELKQKLKYKKVNGEVL